MYGIAVRGPRSSKVIQSGQRRSGVTTLRSLLPLFVSPTGTRMLKRNMAPNISTYVTVRRRTEPRARGAHLPRNAVHLRRVPLSPRLRGDPRFYP